MKNSLKYSIFVILLFIVFSCSKENQEPEPQPHQTKVYAVGMEINNTAIPKYWEDGVEKILPGNNSYPNDIYVTDAGDTYVVGYAYNNGNEYAKMWKNGELTDFFPNMTPSAAYAIEIIGDDIYVAGKIVINNIMTACYWKNSELTILGNQTDRSKANDLFVSGNNIYLVGDEYNNQNNTVAKLWENGTAIDLTDGTQHANAYAVFVSGTDVYVAGNERNNQQIGVAQVWKNGVENPLTDGQYFATAYDVFVAGTNVYVCGYEDNNGLTAKLWTNNTVNNLTNAGVANTVFVHDTDIYVGGSDNKSAVIWKNGQATKLTDGFEPNYVESVFVK